MARSLEIIYEFSSICRLYNLEECQLINQAVQTTIHGKNVVITRNKRLKLHSNTPNYDVPTYVICLQTQYINPLKPELNPICYLLALLGAHHFLHVSRIRVKLLTFRLIMSYIYMEHPFLMFLDHT